MSRVKSVDAAVINRKILPHFEVALQIRPHWQLVSVLQGNQKIERLQVTNEPKRP
jgi:hypothetical protein